MGLFDRFFRKKNTFTSVPKTQSVIPEYARILELESLLHQWLSGDHYVAKSEYAEQVKKYSADIEYFSVLDRSGMLSGFCETNSISEASLQQIIRQGRNIESLVNAANDAFVHDSLVAEEKYFDQILQEVDPGIILDEDQRRVVLTDEDYCLVIAGAGAGKTTTVAAKVKYLVEKKRVDPKQILVVSFTNKAVQELRDKVNNDLKIDCPITTFHSTGNAIIRKQTDEKLNIVDSNKLYYVLQDYFKNSVLKNESMVNNLILFFGSYFDAPYEGDDLNNFFNKTARANFATLRSDLTDFRREIIDSRTKKSVTILSEVLRSRQEVEIANYLYLNGIDYEYEPVYRYDISIARKPYTPDFLLRQDDRTVYLEHFGITESGNNNRFSSDELAAYRKAVNDKITLHRQHGTKLIYTFSQYNDGRPMIEHLREQLENCGFELRPRSNKEVMERLISSEENRYIRKLVTLISRFITNFKTNGYTAEDFNRMYHSTQNVRTRLFLDICSDCYLEYERYLKENNAVDFQDMINESARILREVKEMKKKLDFKYIIVDEYQDISRQRFDLVTALSDVTDAKIIAVGDDWQSIYAFSGSDISLFTKFAEKMGYAQMLKIVKTYRNSQEVIDIAGNFIQKNDSQITKVLKSPKHITDPVIIYTYDATPKKANAGNKTGANYELALAVETALKQIMEYNRQEGKNKESSILLLGRFGFDGDLLERSGLFEYVDRGNKIRSVNYPKLNITFMTAHASKGLGYDNVIVINGRNETYGFPSKIEDDPVLAFVIKSDHSIDYAEERRLFYVAMTRTKNRVFFIAPEQNPSEFLLELKHDYKNVVLRGKWNEEASQQHFAKKTCPICGYPLQYRYKNAYGLRLFICTNEPEVCGFMTNEYRAGRLSIMKCDQCRDGYLIVKPGKQPAYFLGCTNYKADGTGCKNSISMAMYNEIMPMVFKTTADIPVKSTRAESAQPPVAVQEEPVERAEQKTHSIQNIADKPTPSHTEPNSTARKELGITYKSMNLDFAVQTILKCVVHISEKHFYGVNTLIDVLRGSNSERVRKGLLNRCPEYGMLTALSRDELGLIIDWLIENHFILKTKHPQYPVLHPTFDGLHYEEKCTSGMLKKLQKVLEDSGKASKSKG